MWHHKWNYIIIFGPSHFRYHTGHKSCIKMELIHWNSILADCLMICDMSVRYWRRERLVNCTAQCSVSNSTSKSADCGSTSSPPYSHGTLRYQWCYPSIINMSSKCHATPRNTVLYHCLLLHCGALTARWCGVSCMIVRISHIYIFILIHTKLES